MYKAWRRAAYLVQLLLAHAAEPAHSSQCSKRSRCWRYVMVAFEVFCIVKSASRPSRVMRRCSYLQYLDLLDATDKRVQLFHPDGKIRRCWYEIWRRGCGRGICRLVWGGEGEEKRSSGGLPLNKIGRLANFRAAAVTWQRL
jgi:hypothetical protein